MLAMPTYLNDELFIAIWIRAEIFINAIPVILSLLQFIHRLPALAFLARDRVIQIRFLFSENLFFKFMGRATILRPGLFIMELAPEDLVSLVSMITVPAIPFLIHLFFQFNQLFFLLFVLISLFDARD
jgi:hypothetical protein